MAGILSARDCNFSAPYLEERTVFGAARPGYDSKHVGINEVIAWVSFMQDEGVRRVCCLLTQKQLGYYGEENLVSTYVARFGAERVACVGIEDYHLCDVTQLTGRILPFLAKADCCGEKVVVHCSGGMGRTGHILAGWLVHKYGLSVKEALRSVESSGRCPREAVKCGNATMEQLYNLLEQCRKGHSD
jgi:protein-tyrosine phosphatase